MNVLIVDSHPVYIEGLTIVLNKIYPFCRTLTASSLEKGLGILGKSDPVVELFIFCINSASLVGLSQLKAITNSNSDLAIVVIPAVIDCRQSKMLLEMGVRGVVPKLYPIDKMITAFVECCSGQVHVPPEAQSSINRLTIFDENRTKITSRLHLTKRQLQVLDFMDNRISNTEIADILSVSLATVKTHINKLYSALDVCGRKQCIQRSYELGVLYNPKIFSEQQ